MSTTLNEKSPDPDQSEEQMKAIEISSPGGPEVLKPAEVAKPVPKSNEVLIKVAYAGINRPDCLQRAGAYPPPPDASPLPGLEVSGEVVETGKDVTRWKVGDKVCALTAGGGYAEFVTTHAGHALPVPDGFTMLQAAALPENYFTVWHNVFERGELKEGETILIHGGSSGIGSTAIQLAKAIGAKVFATAGSQSKCDACRKFGAEVAINYKEQDFVEIVKQETTDQGVNVILDMVGGDYITRNYQAASPDGRIVQIAFLQGALTQANFVLLMTKRLTHTGSTLRPRTNAFKTALASELELRVWPMLETGKVAPIIDKTYALADAVKAHERMESSRHIGKIMLKVA